jgi:hypothetical protein
MKKMTMLLARAVAIVSVAGVVLPAGALAQSPRSLKAGVPAARANLNGCVPYAGMWKCYWR